MTKETRAAIPDISKLGMFKPNAIETIKSRMPENIGPLSEADALHLAWIYKWYIEDPESRAKPTSIPVVEFSEAFENFETKQKATIWKRTEPGKNISQQGYETIYSQLSPLRESFLKKLDSDSLEKYYIERSCDSDGFSLEDTVHIAIIYANHLFPSEARGSTPISIRSVHKFLKTLGSDEFDLIWQATDPKCQESLYNKKGELRNKRAFDLLNNCRTFDNAFVYSLTFRELVEKIALKLDAEGMDSLTKAKCLVLYQLVIYLSDTFYFEIPILQGSDIPTHVKINLLNEANSNQDDYFTYPDNLRNFYETGFKAVADGAMIFDLIQPIIASAPTDLKSKILDLVGLRQGHRQVHLTRTEIRKLKTELSEPWLISQDFFVCTESMSKIPIRYLNTAIGLYLKGGRENLTRTSLCHLTPVYKDDTYVWTEEYGYYYPFPNSSKHPKAVPVGIRSDCELEAYARVYRWFYNHPEFPMGDDDATLRMPISNWIESGKIQDPSFELMLKMLFIEAGFTSFDKYSFKIAKSMIPKSYEKHLIRWFKGELTISEFLVEWSKRNIRKLMGMEDCSPEQIYSWWCTAYFQNSPNYEDCLHLLFLDAGIGFNDFDIDIAYSMFPEYNLGFEQDPTNKNALKNFKKPLYKDIVLSYVQGDLSLEELWNNWKARHPEIRLIGNGNPTPSEIYDWWSKTGGNPPYETILKKWCIARGLYTEETFDPKKALHDYPENCYYKDILDFAIGNLDPFAIEFPEVNKYPDSNGSNDSYDLALCILLLRMGIPAEEICIANAKNVLPENYYALQVYYLVKDVCPLQTTAADIERYLAATEVPGSDLAVLERASRRMTREDVAELSVFEMKIEDLLTMASATKEDLV